MGISRNLFLILFLLLTFRAEASLHAPEFLGEIYQNTLSDSQFNKTYIKSGCFIRAHWIANLIQKSGHEPLKVFFETASASEKMQIELNTGKKISWVFHVVAGFKDGNGQIWIVDPILAKEVSQLNEFISLIKNQNPKLNLRMNITGPEVYHVDENENAEFLLNGKPFSKKAMEFINDAMEDLFTWDQAEKNN